MSSSIVGTSLDTRQSVRNKIFPDTVTIANGQSLSGAINVGNTSLIGLYIPAAWTAADITFQASNDNVTFYNMVDIYGNEIVLSLATASTYRPVTLADFIGPKYIKVRSGNSATAVNQAADRVITLLFREI